MHLSAFGKTGLLLLAFALAGSWSWTAAKSSDQDSIAATIKTDVAQLVAGLNAHDVARTTAYDAPDVVSMECGRPSTTGIAAEREGFQSGFARNPHWRVSMIGETVDVAGSGDMAVYHGTYNEDSAGQNGVPTTRRMNFTAEFRRQGNGPWKIVWSSVSDMEPSHQK